MPVESACICTCRAQICFPSILNQWRKEKVCYEWVWSCVRAIYFVVTHRESRQLWRRMEPYFRTVMNTIYLRDMSLLNQGGTCPSSPPLPRTSDLPTSSKYLLIASFLASYNPTKTDRRIFSKVSHAIILVVSSMSTLLYS